MGLKIIANQLVKNVKKQPGWVPLVLVYYLYMWLWIAPEDITFLEISLNKHTELIVIIMAFLSYQIGDAIDKAIFKRLEPKWLDQSRTTAKKNLSLDEGFYKVSKDLAEAAGKYEGTWIQVCNEMSKFFRSAAVPVAVLGAVLLVCRSLVLGIFALLAVFVLFLGYIFLKALHIRKLYEMTEVLSKDSKYGIHDLPIEVRLFFWNGVLVSSGRRSPSSDAA